MHYHYVTLHARMYSKYMHTHVHTYIRCVNVRTYVYVSMYICTYERMYVSIHACMRTGRALWIEKQKIDCLCNLLFGPNATDRSFE